MLVAKQVADIITFSRALLAFLLAWLGVTQGETALPVTVWLMIADWVGDSLDGTLARRSRLQYQTWVGDHDLEVDVLVSLGLLVYMLTAGLVDLLWVALYLILWALIFWRWGFPRPLGMLVQAPIYGWFIWMGLTRAPTAGVWLLVCLLAMVVVTWPRFPNEVVPGFLAGMREVVRGGQEER